MRAWNTTLEINLALKMKFFIIGHQPSRAFAMEGLIQNLNLILCSKREVILKKPTGVAAGDLAALVARFHINVRNVLKLRNALLQDGRGMCLIRKLLPKLGVYQLWIVEKESPFLMI